MQKSEVTESVDVSRGTLLDTGLVPIEEAARNLGIDVKRLRGYVWRNGLRDPIGDANFVYGWSCRELARAATSTLTAIPGTATGSEAGAVK